MEVVIDTQGYTFSTKQFKEVRRFIKAKDPYVTDYGYEVNPQEYTKVIKKYNIKPRG